MAAALPPFFGRQLVRQLYAVGYFSLPVVGLTAVFTGAALALNIYTGGARFQRRADHAPRSWRSASPASWGLSWPP